MMKAEVFWVGMILMMTACLFIPYAMNMLMKQGLGAMHYYDPTLPGLDPWAQRAKKAHANAVENLVILAPAALAYFYIGGQGGGDGILISLQVYFFARLAHYIIYTAGWDYIRTPPFFIGWLATMCIIWKVMALAMLP